MTVLALIRPDSWNFPLLLHILGAAVFFGVVAGAVVLTLSADRTPEPAAMRRLAFRSMLLAGLPAYIVMRGGAEWMYSKEFPNVDSDPTWIGIGYSTADGGLLLALIATVLAWRASRRGAAGPGGLGRAVVGLSAVLLVAYAVAIWAMTTKPD